ncbi:hypothetical protein SBA7_940036 [Candidatus Sulfotelmatobacter sp. SbA7]|nr:hypothetical protein SBA7_940036 [Candidatus Sulfotelmatobacter sp. SbA7]
MRVAARLPFMALLSEESRETETVQALVQLLRTRSYEEIRQRMYDNPPGSAWWSACKTGCRQGFGQWGQSHHRRRTS